MKTQFSKLAILALLGMLHFGCSSDGASTTTQGGSESDASLTGIEGEGGEEGLEGGENASGGGILPDCAPTAEICNGLDDDCDGEIDDGFPDEDENGIADCFEDDTDQDLSLIHI